MSNRALNWAFDSGIPAGQRFVLVVLADAGSDHSGEDWTCFPSVKSIMDMTGMGRSTVERHISWLRDEGWVSIEPRRRKDGTLGINDYRLHRDANRRAELKAERAGQTRVPGLRAVPQIEGTGPLKSRDTTPQIEGTSRGEPPLKSRGQEPLAEPSMEPSARAREPGSEGLDEVGVLWPVKGRKFTDWPTARAKWAWACELVGEAAMVAALRAASADPDLVRRKFVPALDRWLTDEGWRAYLPSKASAGCAVAGAARTEFAGPPELRAAIVADPRFGEGFAGSFLDRARWDELNRIVYPATSVAADRLRDAAHHFSAKLVSLGGAPVSVSGGK